jgi:hypothetical protein
MGIIDISDLVTSASLSQTHDLVSWLSESVGPVVRYTIPWPASIGCGWQLLIVSYTLRLAHPEARLRSWALELQDERDVLMFKLRWL